MTAFGKILIFLNLVFALLVGGLIGMVYLTRTNWKVAYDKLQAGATAAHASYEQILNDRDKQKDAANSEKNAAIAKRDEVAKQLKTTQDEVKQLQDQLEATKRT